MAAPTVFQQSLSLQMLATYRRFIRWLTSAKVIMALFMLALMVYLILVPLYRMLEATVTYQDRDVHSVQDAVVGQFTTYHWIRMLTEPISEVLTYAPLQHSLVISVGAT
jgi:riboflavin transporter FmnP